MNIISRLKNGPAGIDLRRCLFALSVLFVATICSVACGFLLIAPHIEVDPQQLSFEAVAGGEPPASQLFAVSCETDDPDYYYRDCDATITTDQAWITVDKTLVEHFGTVNVTVDPAGMVPGTYTGRVDARNEQITFDDQKRVDIILVVRAAE